MNNKAIRISHTKSFLNFLVVLLSIGSLTDWLSLPIALTMFWWIVYALFTYCLIRLSPPKEVYYVKYISIWKLLLISNILYGCYMAEYYWDFKQLINHAFAFVLPVASLTFWEPDLLAKFLSSWKKYTWVFFVLLFPFMEYENAYGMALIPFMVLSLFYSFLSPKDRVSVIISVIICCTIGLMARSNFLRSVFALFLGAIIYKPFIYSKVSRLMRSIHILAFILPPVLVVFAILGTFNVFNMQENLGLSDDQVSVTSKNGEEPITNDTRTFIYEEEILSAISNNYVIQGRSMARGYDCPFFSWMIDEQLHGKGKYHEGERGASEVNILNVFNYFGLIGVFLYFSIFWTATKKALFHSNNKYVTIVGLFVLFRWTLCWIEEFTRCDALFLSLWILIGICYSPKFRNMTDEEIKEWVKKI